MLSYKSLGNVGIGYGRTYRKGYPVFLDFPIDCDL